MSILLNRANDRVNVSHAHEPAQSLKPLVLVVEDHEDTRFMLEYLLEMRGCRVLLAADGLDGVRLAESEHPHLILMDATLPRLDGLTATRRIRASGALNDVPIIFLSGNAQPSFQAAAFASGADDYLVKPFALDQLESMFERHLGQVEH